MKVVVNALTLGFTLSLIFSACKKEKDDVQSQIIVKSASGDIVPTINEFRALLGASVNTTTGHTSGRREINWDGVPDIYENEKIPVDYFNPVGPGATAALQRGFIYAATADARVSASDFAALETSNASEFAAFSGSKTFSAVNSNLWTVNFQVPGQAQAAGVRGFGAVFSDVDIASSTTMEFFSGNVSLGVYKVPVRTAGSYSFLGVYFPNEKITGVKIKQGDSVLGSGVKDISSGGNHDLVVMDDFLYDEPQGL